MKFDKIKQVLHKMWYLKYAIVAVIGVLYVGFLDENSVLKHIQNTRRISELESEIAQHEQRHQRDQKQVRLLKDSPAEVRRIARERYFMKTDDEDIFVLSDDPREYRSNAAANEAAE